MNTEQTLPSSSIKLQAARLYPNNPILQEKWIQAIAVVRKTQEGWILDRIQKRMTSAAPTMGMLETQYRNMKMERR